jgi:hypothetical protein
MVWKDMLLRGGCGLVVLAMAEVAPAVQQAHGIISTTISEHLFGLMFPIYVLNDFFLLYSICMIQRLCRKMFTCYLFYCVTADVRALAP